MANDDDIIIYDDEPDPMSMSKEEYFKAKEEYNRRVRIQSEKMRKKTEEDTKNL
jgi:hypothetical protein